MGSKLFLEILIKEKRINIFGRGENLFLLYSCSSCQEDGVKERISEIRCKGIVNQCIELLGFLLQVFQIRCVFLLQFCIQLILGLDKLIHDFQFSAVQHHSAILKGIGCKSLSKISNLLVPTEVSSTGKQLEDRICKLTLKQYVPW